jgi:hypothetical protein
MPPTGAANTPGAFQRMKRLRRTTGQNAALFKEVCFVMVNPPLAGTDRTRES